MRFQTAMAAAFFRAKAAFIPSCLRKSGYPTREAAQQWADRCAALRGWRLRVYQCEACNKFHLTKKGPQR